MHVRQARPSDADAVRRVAEAAWHDAHDPIVGPDVVDDFLAKHYEPDDLRDRYRTADSTTFVAIADGELVGYASGVPSSDCYTLGAVYVHPDSQGRGVGSRLLERVEADARDAGYDAIDLVVMADNDDSIGFYESRGFERVGDHYDEFLDVDGYVYEKQL